MNSTVKRALKHYMMVVQIAQPYDWEFELAYTEKKLTYISNGGAVDFEWVLSDALYFKRVFVSYGHELKDKYENLDYDDIAVLREERKTVKIILDKIFEFLEATGL